MWKRADHRMGFAYLAATVIVITFPAFGMAQPQAGDALVAAFDQVIEKQGFHAGEPGVAVLIRQPGRFLFQKGYGLANLKTQKPITPETVFELASVSKTFTATAVLILHDRGKLSIEEDVRKHIPELPEYQKSHPIRIRDLLQHTSGLPDYMEFEDITARHKTYRVNEDYVGLFARQKKEFPLDFRTGEKYDYNNTNFMLLAVVVERVAKKPFSRFLRDEIFNPVGMQHSFVFDRPDAGADPAAGRVHAVGYEWRKKKAEWAPSWGLPPDRHEEMLTVGDGSVWTNLEDMAKWDEAVREQKLLKAATWNLALTPSKTRDGQTNGYGLGWGLYFNNGGETYGFGHDGSWGGFETSYYRYLAADRTTVILSNRGTCNTDKVWTALEGVVERQLSRKK